MHLFNFDQNRSVYRVFALAAISAILCTGGASAQGTGTIQGSVVSAQDGSGLSDVDVFIEGIGRRALTNRSGRFQFLELSSGTYSVVAERVGFGTARQEITVGSGSTSQLSFQLEDEAISIPEVIVIASRDAKDLSEVAASVGVIGGSAIREAQAGHPSEIMGQIPGVYVNVTGGEGHMTAIRQPLSTSPLYLYLEDGVPTRSTGFFNHNALYEINVPQADRIEVMKGPANAMYGSDAIGGVINVGTRAPSQEARAELSVEGGGHGFQKYLGSYSGTSGANGFRADANYTLTDGWREGTDYNRYSGTLRWDRSLGAGSSLKTVATYSNIDQNTAGSSAISRTDFETNPEVNYTPISYRQITALRLSSAFEKQSGDWTWSLTPFARSNSMEILPNWSLTYDPAIWEVENQSMGLLAKTRYDVPSGRVSVTGGVDLDYSPGRHDERKVTPNRVAGIFESYIDPGTSLYDYDVAFRQVAPYIHAEAAPTDRLHLSAGLRADFLGYDYTNHLGIETTGRHRRPGDASPTFNAISPKFGATLNIREGLDLFSSFRRGFRAPSEGQLFRQGSAINTVNLKPVKANSLEAGLRGSVGQRIRYELSGYHMSKTDDILAFRLPDGSMESVNAGETLHKGIELGLGFQLVRGLSADVAYSIAEHTYEDWKPNLTTNLSGNEQEFAPSQIGSARLRIAPPALPRSLLALEWSHVGPYSMDASNEHEYEGHHLFNLRYSYGVTDRVEIFGRVNNVLNELYAERASFNAYRGEELSPGLPRTFYLGMRVQ